MRVLSLLILALTLNSCNMHDRMILYQPVPLKEQSRKNRDDAFERGTYQEIVEGLRENAPDPGLVLYRTGRMDLVNHNVKVSYHFEFEFKSSREWTWLINDVERGDPLFSLKRNTLGLTYQDLQGEIFLQGSEATTWKKLQEFKWQSLLDEAWALMFNPTFNPRHPWQIEADGLKYLIITRVDRSVPVPVKLQYYLHKKSNTLQKVIKSTVAQNIVEELMFTDFKDVGTAYLPTHMSLTRSLAGEKIVLKTHITELKKARHRAYTIKDL